MSNNEEGKIVEAVNITPLATDETGFEFFLDGSLGLVFLVIAIIAAQRMAWSRSQGGGAETTVVTAFYSLILATSALRAIWFLIPSSWMVPSYVPSAVMAFDPNDRSWIGAFVSQILQSAGSLCLFGIFILILVYWADILKKYFYPGARRSRPMSTFLILVVLLAAAEILNSVLYLLGVYSSEGMVLANSVLLATVSIVCVCEITIFSYRFRTVLKTLGAINQVSTESQVRRIVWITVTGNMFFFTRAFLESIFAVLLFVYWRRNGSVAEVFSHGLWDVYIALKHWSEVAILGLMLYILQSRFATSSNAGDDSRGSYREVPDAQGDGPKVPSSMEV